MAKVILKGFILVPAEDLDSVRHELPAHISLTRAEPGCVTFEVTESDQQSHRFDVYEEFIDREAFDRHQMRVAESDWGKITKNVSRHYQILE